MHFATNNSNKNTRKFGIVRSSDSEFSLFKFSSAQLEILPNLRYAGVFQMSTTVNLEIGLTRPGVKLDEKMRTAVTMNTRPRMVFFSVET